MLPRHKTRGLQMSRARMRGVRARACVSLLGAALLTGCGSEQDLVIGSNDWVQVRHDDFDSLDLEFWERATHTFEQNQAWFSEQNAQVDQGELVLTVTKQATPAAPAAGQVPKPYAAAELRSRPLFLYGRFRTRVRLAPGVGIITSFWGFYDHYAINAPDSDDQIVIEGANDPQHVLRFFVVVPQHDTQPDLRSLDFDPSLSTHELGFDWTPSEVRFYLDGVLQSTVAGDATAGLSQYQRLVLSAYPSRAAWTGTFDDSVLPVAARFDWVDIYQYAGQR
jgi:beta-glucanase (GH16 family)